MKRNLFVFIVVILCVLHNNASADRYVNADDYENVEEFYEAIEMGTIITVNGFIYSSPFKYEMDGIKGYSITVFIDFPGCVRKTIFLMASEEQAKDLEEGDYISISGKMFSRGNTGKNYYFNTQIENGYVEELEIPEPTVFDLNEDINDLTSRVKSHRIGDIAKGESLKVVLTDEYTDSFMSNKTTYYYYLSAGNMFIMFYTHSKDLFKGDVIDFQGVIYDYDEEHKILFCNDPEYYLRE